MQLVSGKKKTPGIIILIVWFIWSTGSDIYNLINAGGTDYYIFSSNGLTPLFFFFVVAILLLDAATLRYLFRPRPAGFYVALSALTVSLTTGHVSDPGAAYVNQCSRSLSDRTKPSLLFLEPHRLIAYLARQCDAPISPSNP